MIEDLAAVGDADACLAQLDRSRATLVAILGSLDDERLATKAGDGGWSAAQVAEHVAIVERGSARIIRALAAAVERGVPPAIQPPPGVRTADGRMMAPAAAMPGEGLPRAELLAMLAAAREELRAMTAAHAATLDGAMTISHPFYGGLNGLGWLRMAATHERHHVEAMEREVLDLRS